MTGISYTLCNAVLTICCQVDTFFNMEYEIERTEQFDAWFASLKDRGAKIRIAKRLEAMTWGGFGDHKQIADKLFELRMFYGPGYRAYFTIRGGKIILLLIGGDKKSQADDIRKAKAMLNRLEDEE